ncbi:MAG: phage major capsid protein [Candidatus Bilamarchaeaceae archaeon]
MEIKELEALKNEIIDKSAEKVIDKVSERILNEVNSKYITLDEMKKALKEYVENAKVYDVEPGLLTKNIKAMVEGTASAGGYLVAPQYVDRIFDVAMQSAVVFPKVTRIPLGSNQAYFTGVSSGITFSYPGEATAPNETKPTLTQTAVSVKKGMALTDISNELLADATIGGAVDSYLVNLLGRAYGKEMDRIILAGNTVNGDPFNGILSTANTITVRTASTTGIDYDALISTITAISDDYNINPMWVMHRLVLRAIYQLKDTVGRPLVEIPAKQLLGYPLGTVEVMPDTIAADKPLAIFGDFAQVYFGARQELQIAVSKEAKFSQDLTELRATFRFAIHIPYPSAFAVLMTKAA